MTRDARIAREQAYRLLAEFFVNGLTPGVHAELVTAGLIVDQVVPDPAESAARHHGLMGFNVLPYASVYLSEDGQLGGIVEQDIRATIHQTGFHLAGTAIDTPDHLGALLMMLSKLVGAEASHKTQTTWDVASQSLVSRHVLSWLPTLIATLVRIADPVYTDLARLALDLLLHHHQSLPPDTEPTAFKLPLLPQLQVDPSKGFQKFARVMSRPALCGIYLSRTDLANLSADQQLPQGFGDRTRQLNNLLTSAYRFDAFSNVTSGMAAILDQQEAEWQAVAGTSATLEHVRDTWLGRLHQTRRMLKSLSMLA